MKKYWIPLTLGLIVILGGIVGAAMLFRKPVEKGPVATPTPPPERVNIIPVEERPYAFLTPSVNGRTLTLTVGSLKKDAGEGEYELDYQFGNNLQNGAYGRIDIEDLPGAKYDILLGSCSAGGKCSYDEDVTGGSLLLRFEDPEKYVLKNEWAFIENADKETLFSSRDAKFSIEGTRLSTVPFAVILQTPGLPEIVDQGLLSDGYAVRFATKVTGSVTVQMRLKEDVSDAQMLGWDGTAWVQLETTVEEKIATAESSTVYEAYVVVQASE